MITKINIDDILRKRQVIHFVGIGGAGMFPLAKLFMGCGGIVSGSDKENSAKTAELASLGASIHVGHNADNLPDNTSLLVYSSAVGPDNPERQKAGLLNMPQIKRGDFLGIFSKRYKRVVAISGSHGKSTISAMLSGILVNAGMSPGFLIGAEVNNGPNSAVGNGDIFVTEADESDGTHTALSPFITIVPNIDDDHAWSLGGRENLINNFRLLASQSTHLVFYSGIPQECRFFEHQSGHPLILPPDDYNYCDLYGFQAQDAKIAVEAAKLLGVSEEKSEEYLHSFSGIGRRMSCRYQEGNRKFMLIEDYAHHPRELQSSLNWLKHKYSDCELTVVFQPHRYARLERYFQEFAAILTTVKTCYVAPVFAAWTETGKVNHAALAKASKSKTLSGNWQKDAQTIIASLNLNHKNLIAVIGAGDINKIIPELTGIIKQVNKK